MISRRRTKVVKRCLKAAVAAVAFSLGVPLAGNHDVAPVAGDASAQHFRPWRIDLASPPSAWATSATWATVANPEN